MASGSRAATDGHDLRPCSARAAGPARGPPRESVELGQIDFFIHAQASACVVSVPWPRTHVSEPSRARAARQQDDARAHGAALRREPAPATTASRSASQTPAIAAQRAMNGHDRQGVAREHEAPAVDQVEVHGRKHEEQRPLDAIGPGEGPVHGEQHAAGRQQRRPASRTPASGASRRSSSWPRTIAACGVNAAACVPKPFRNAGRSMSANGVVTKNAPTQAPAAASTAATRDRLRPAFAGQRRRERHREGHQAVVLDAGRQAGRGAGRDERAAASAARTPAATAAA